MKITVLDRNTAQNEDYIRTFGSIRNGCCRILKGHDAMSVFPDSLPDTEILVADLAFQIRAELMDALEDLKCICALSTGYSNIDIQHAKDKGIVVCNAPGYATESTAQHVFTLLSDLTHNPAGHSALVKMGVWETMNGKNRPVEIAGKTMGIVGLGAIGSRVAEIARAFRMNVMASTRTPKPEQFPWIEFVNIDRLFHESDVVTLHAPSTPKTQGLVQSARLALMKPTAYLINTSRGDVVAEEDLAKALDEEKIAGAGLDVLAQEPPDQKNPLLYAPNCIITPHIANKTREAVARLLALTADNVRAFIEGNPQNVIG